MTLRGGQIEETDPLYDLYGFSAESAAEQADTDYGTLLRSLADASGKMPPEFDWKERPATNAEACKRVLDVVRAASARRTDGSHAPFIPPFAPYAARLPAGAGFTPDYVALDANYKTSTRAVTAAVMIPLASRDSLWLAQTHRLPGISALDDARSVVDMFGGDRSQGGSAVQAFNISTGHVKDGKLASEVPAVVLSAKTNLDADSKRKLEKARTAPLESNKSEERWQSFARSVLTAELTFTYTVEFLGGTHESTASTVLARRAPPRCSVTPERSRARRHRRTASARWQRSARSWSGSFAPRPADRRRWKTGLDSSNSQTAVSQPKPTRPSLPPNKSITPHSNSIPILLTSPHRLLAAWPVC